MILELTKALEEKLKLDQVYNAAQINRARTFENDLLADLQAIATQKEREESQREYNRKLHRTDDQATPSTQKSDMIVVLRTTQPTAEESANNSILFIVLRPEQIKKLTDLFHIYKRSSACSADRSEFKVVSNEDQSEVQLHFGTCKPHQHIKHFIDTISALQNNRLHEIPKQLDDVKHLLAIFQDQLLIERDIQTQIHANTQTQNYNSITLRRK